MSIKVRKTVANILGRLGIHSYVNIIRFYIPNLIKSRFVKKYGVEAIGILNEVFEKRGSFFWLEFGTLLGAYRDKAFISNDFDIDLGVLAEKRIEDLDKILEPLGFKRTRKIYIKEKGITEETFVYKKLHIDIMYFYPENQNIICYLYATEPGEHWRDVRYTKGFLATARTFTDTGFHQYPFYSLKCFVPKDTDLHLRECYGNYKVRVKNWNDDNSPNLKITNLRVLHTKLD
jgi:phosphorylcholine metabolism protein LicD